MPSLDRNSPVPFYLQVYEQLAHGIESGLFPPGKKLPSIRECARELGVSNTTIELAYQRLSAEGYVQARRGSGYTICKVNPQPSNRFDRFSADYQAALEELAQSEQAKSVQPEPAFDFAYDAVDATMFPFTTWARICREVFFAAGSNEACLYNDRQGLHSLRERIAQYLGSEFGVTCTSGQVLVTPTTRDLVTEIVGLFDPESTTVAMGDPGYDEVRKRLGDRGYRMRAVSAYPYPSWEQMEAALEGAQVVFTTPACQFPSNVPMPLEMRAKLVAWAQEHDAYIIDDEYSWEFQPGVSRMPSLATLDDAGHVITMGTFSNSFTPAVCLSYAVLPPQLMLAWRRERGGGHPQVPWQTQAAMTTFMAEDHWRTHIRKLRTAVSRKRQALAEAIASHLGDSVQVIEGTSSLFMLVQTRDGRGESELVEAAAREGVRVYPTSQYWQAEPPANWRYVLVGYAGIPIDDIEPGVQALVRAWSI